MPLVVDPEALLELARRLGDLRAEALVLVVAAMRNLTMGDLPGCASRVLEALELARRTGTWYLEESGLFALVVALTVAGRTAEAVGNARSHSRCSSRNAARLPTRVLAIYDDSPGESQRILGTERIR